MTTKTKPGKLDAIANTMRSNVMNGAAWAEQRLERGLVIVLQRRVEQDGKHRWRLALGRTDVAPSDDEIAICCRSFGVPAGTEHEVKRTERTSKKTGKLITWHIVEMYWYEA